MQNVSGYGLSINIIASNTFPIGFGVTEFADDNDPLDVPSLQIGDSAMGLNGDLIAWSKANPIKVTLNVIPGSVDDRNLSILLDANRVGKGKVGARDTITMNIQYPEPDGSFVQLINGIITDGMPFTAVASSGRKKTNNYQFTFENRVGG